MLDKNLLICPTCRGLLESTQEGLHCEQCKRLFPIIDGVPVFIPEAAGNVVASHTRKRSFLRKALHCLQPPHHSVYFNNLRSSHGEGRELKVFLNGHRNGTVLNIGSLSKNLRNLHPNIVNLDLARYPSVDIVADAHALPFRDGSIDVILFKNVLEHIRTPAVVMAEIKRVLKDRGILYIKLPFLQPYHAVPDDYQRYTVSGMKELLKEYRELGFGISVGPASMLSWVVREELAILTSFGNGTLYKCGLFFWGWLTFWIKYFDIFFRGNRFADRLASAYYGFYQKT
jgi:uncharacterized protein YbaR (Trm112 family)